MTVLHLQRLGLGGDVTDRNIVMVSSVSSVCPTTFAADEEFQQFEWE